MASQGVTVGIFLFGKWLQREGLAMSSTHPVGHAGKGATPILDQCVSTETNRGLAFLSASLCTHLAAMDTCATRLHASGSLLDPGTLASRGSVPHMGQVAPLTLWVRYPWCLHFTDPEKVSHPRP